MLVALVKVPRSRLATLRVTLKVVSSSRLSLSLGLVMTVETMLVVAGILPMTVCVRDEREEMKRYRKKDCTYQYRCKNPS